jgi:hypothetical protein
VYASCGGGNVDVLEERDGGYARLATVPADDFRRTNLAIRPQA